MGVRGMGTGLSDRGQQTGLLVAAAVAPGTFEPLLVPRSALDQGVVTGLATSLSYLLTVTTQDTLEAAASMLAPRLQAISAPSQERAAAALLDLAAISAGLVARRALRPRAHESTVRALARLAAWGAAMTGLGGLTLAAVQVGTRSLDDRLGADGRLAAFPVAIPAGLMLGWAIESARRPRSSEELQAPADTPADRARAAAIGIGIAGGLSAAAYGERLVANSAGSIMSARLPGSPTVWRLSGHAVCLGGLVFAGGFLFDRTMQRIEAGEATVEPVLDDDTADRWVGPTVSGGRDSLVPWSTPGSCRAAARVRLCAAAARCRPPEGDTGPVDRDGDGRAGEGHSRPGLRRLRQRTDRSRAGRAGARRDGPHRRVGPLGADADLADRHRLRELLRDRGRSVPDPR